jgi:hypothetical protein
MKPASIFTAAAVMTAGIISFVEFSTSAPPSQTPMQVAEATQSQPVKNVTSESNKSTTPAVAGAEEKKAEPVKAEPVAENKPAATVTDAAKSTMNATGEHVKDAATDSVKSALPTPNMPTSPAAAAAKTVVTPSAIPTPVPTPTK